MQSPYKKKPLKLAMIGPQKAGKTSVINRFHNGTFDKNTIATVGASFITHVFEIDGQQVTCQIWDTAGQEKYRSLGPIYYRDAVCALSMFDLTSNESFDEMKLFLTQFRDHCSDYVHIAIIGHKKDVYNPETGVDLDIVRNWATGQGWSFHLTSARTGEGVTEMFETVAVAVVDKMCERKQITVATLDTVETGARGCC